MQSPTLPPWLSPWSSGALYGRRKMSVLDYYHALVRERARQRSLQSRLTIYTYGNDDSKILRIGGWSGRENTARPLTGWGERYPLDQYPLEHYPLDRYPMDLAAPAPRLPHDLTQLPGRVNVEWQRPATLSPPPYSRGALRAWLAATALLALLVLLVRVAERCLDRNLLKRRRRSQEWPTPNVRATSTQLIDEDTVYIPGLENVEPLPADLSDSTSVDLPPPYSECTPPSPGDPAVSAPGTSFAHNKMSSDILHEEPPPPYSDCYVEFSNKNGVPSVLIFSRRRTPLVNRCEITGEESEVINIDEEEMRTDQNVENTNTDITNSNADNDERDTSNIYFACDNNSPAIYTNMNIQHTESGPSSSEVDNSKDESPQSEVVLV